MVRETLVIYVGKKIPISNYCIFILKANYSWTEDIWKAKQKKQKKIFVTEGMKRFLKKITS